MSGISVAFDVREVAPERINSIALALEDRQPLHRAIGVHTFGITRDWLIDIARTRHDSARRLGAAPTGHWSQAAEKTTYTATEEVARVSVYQPGIGRAAHDVTIEPGPGKQFLALPAIAQAYGQRAYRVPDLVFIRTGAKQTAVLVKKDKGREIGTVWYWLVKSVFQRQDRTLLPSDEHYSIAGLKAFRDYLKAEALRRRTSGGRK